MLTILALTSASSEHISCFKSCGKAVASRKTMKLNLESENMTQSGILSRYKIS